MIKANELRIGNLIQFNFSNSFSDRKPNYGEFIFDVFTIFENAIKINIGHGATQTMPVEHIEPIPLTEEWLLKFGFEGDRITYKKGYLEFGWYGDSKFYYLPTGQISYRFSRPIEFVHQLQNLYFAFMGEELTLKN